MVRGISSINGFWLILLVFQLVYQTATPVVPVRQLQRLNAGMATSLKIPIEEHIEKIRSHPHRKAALIRSLGATALKQRAGRNLIFRVLVTIGYESNLVECIARVMCEVTCDQELNRAANNDLDTYPTDPIFVTYALQAAERGREFGVRHECANCGHFYPLCDDAKTKQHVLNKYHYLNQITKFVLSTLPT